NAYNFLAVLKENYEGEDVDYVYGYDLLNEKVFVPQVELNYSVEDIRGFLAQPLPEPFLVSRMERIYKIGEERNRELKIKEMTEKIKLEINTDEPEKLADNEYVQQRINDALQKELKPTAWKISLGKGEVPSNPIKSGWLFEQV